VRAIRRELGLDRPLPVQYVRYLGDLVTGHLGRSIQTGQPVADPRKEPDVKGSLVSPSSGGATNWWPPF